MSIFSILLAIMAGVFTTIESNINSQLGKHITPSIATLHSLIVGTTFFLLANIIKGNLVRYQKITSVSPILLIGGLFGAFIIYLSSKSIPVLGSANTMILILSGQLLSSLLVDACINDVAISVKKLLGMVLFLLAAIIYLKE